MGKPFSNKKPRYIQIVRRMHRRKQRKKLKLKEWVNEQQRETGTLQESS